MEKEFEQVPGFQTQGRFDPAKLTEIVQGRLPALGFSDTVVDELVRKQVRVKKVRELIGATVVLSAEELQNRYAEANEKMDLSVIRLNASDVEKEITVSDEERKGLRRAQRGLHER